MRITSKVLKSLIRQCIDDRCPQIAASLAYTTLLALIPLTVVIYKIFTTALIAPELQIKVQQFVFNSLSPTTADQVRQYLFNASNINIVGLLMLFISVVIMMYTIDSALNRIWKINKPRYMLRRFIVYISVLVLGPLAISFSMFISTYLASLQMLWILRWRKDLYIIYRLLLHGLLLPCYISGFLIVRSDGCMHFQEEPSPRVFLRLPRAVLRSM